jgi:serine/threonine-protein kinase
VRPGDTIGHYRIEDLIGSGGMGEVYLALDSRLHRKVAIKIIQRSGKAEEEESAQRLLREARTAASLTHPNIVSVFDVGEHEGRVYLAMEHVVGRTLREYVGTGDPPWTKRVRWLLDMARGLAAAHKKGLVHRDIKPENVMVRDEDGLIKVLDFGIARKTVSDPIDPTGRTESASFATGQGQISGTPMYMAPEQIKGGAPNTQSDQFAWGIVAFELLAGRRPWPERGDLLAMVATVLTEPPASLSELAPDLPATIHEIIQRAIARNPAERYATMEEVADALELHVAGSGSAPRVSAPPNKESTKKSVAVPSGVELKRVSGKTFDPETPKTTGGNMVTERSPGAEPPPPRPPRTKKRFVIVALVLGAIGCAFFYWRGTNHPKPVKPIASIGADAGPPPKPPTENAEAARLYVEGVQLWKDGAWIKAQRSLEDAAAKDPGFAAPNLLLALLQATNDRLGAAREPYQRALVQRKQLLDIERALLDAMDPALQGVEPDFEEAEKRARVHTDKDGRDLWSLVWLGWVRAQRDDYENSQKAYERAIRVDPAFVPARRGVARALVDLGRTEQAKKELDECIKTAPSAAICLRDRLWLADRAGKCADMEQDARAWSNIERDASEPDYQLAVALAAEGQAQLSIQEALRRQWTKMSQTDRKTAEPADQADLAVFVGDFTAGERFAHTWENALKADADVLEHAGPELLLAHLAFEAGDTNGAADIADSFEKRMKGYSQRMTGLDPSLDFDELLYRGSRITKAELDTRRVAWIGRMEAKETQKEKQRRSGVRWASVYAGFAENQEEAKEALAKQNDFMPMPPDARAPLEFAAATGKTYALAGKADDALPYLERVTRSCSALKNPALQTRSFYFLGMAYETKGDLEGAKKAYKAVVDRWGAAKPRSTTAEKAKAQLARLGP